MNLAGFRYALETMHAGRWKLNLSTDDKELAEKFFSTTIDSNKQRPARLIDRSIDKVLKAHLPKS